MFLKLKSICTDTHTKDFLHYFQCYLYKNEQGQTKVVSTLLPSAADGKPWPSGAGCMKDGLRYHRIVNFLTTAERVLTKALIGGRGVAYSYIRVLTDEFLLKSTNDN